MSVVVAILTDKEMVMAADSIVVRGSIKAESGDSKIWENGEYLFGGVGTCRGLQILRWHWSLPERTQGQSTNEFFFKKIPASLRTSFANECYLKAENEIKSISENFIFMNKDSIFLISSDLSIVVPKENYITIGYGWEIALGSLHSTSEMKNLSIQKRAEMAIEAACHFSYGCMSPVVSIHKKFK